MLSAKRHVINTSMCPWMDVAFFHKRGRAEASEKAVGYAAIMPQFSQWWME